MKLKELESALQGVEVFTNPKVQLEQYPTGAHLAACMLYTIETQFDDIEGCSILDLGCGTGVLAIGAALLGSPSVVGIDCDAAALEIAHGNIAGFDGIPVDLVQGDVAALSSWAHLRADTVIMNPPFGTRSKGADIAFLQAGIQAAKRAVYSLHKTSTRAHVRRCGEAHPAVAAAGVIAELRYDLPASYKFHKFKMKDIEVDLWRFELRRAKLTE